MSYPSTNNMNRLLWHMPIVRCEDCAEYTSVNECECCGHIQIETREMRERELNKYTEKKVVGVII